MKKIVWGLGVSYFASVTNGVFFKTQDPCSDWLISVFQGEFYSVQSHTDPPFKAEPFNLPEDKGHMLSLGLSEFTVNSASYAYFSAGLLQAQINDSMVCVRLCVEQKSLQE